MRRLALALTLGALGVAGCGGDDDDQANDGSAQRSPAGKEATPAESANGAAVVEMNDQLAFEPKQIEVVAGEKVTWKNVGKVAHTVTADKSNAADPSLVSIPEGAKEWDSGFVGEGSRSRARSRIPVRTATSASRTRARGWWAASWSGDAHACRGSPVSPRIAG